jgi:hypothetical protein
MNLKSKSEFDTRKQNFFTVSNINERKEISLRHFATLQAQPKDTLDVIVQNAVTRMWAHTRRKKRQYCVIQTVKISARPKK